MSSQDIKLVVPFSFAFNLRYKQHMLYYFDGAEKIFGKGMRSGRKKKKKKKTKAEKILDLAKTLHVSPNIASNIYNKCEYYGNNGIEVDPREEVDAEIEFARHYG